MKFNYGPKAFSTNHYNDLQTLHSVNTSSFFIKNVCFVTKQKAITVLIVVSYCSLKVNLILLIQTDFYAIEISIFL